MTDTEIKLLALYRRPAVPLAEICEKYLSLGRQEAYRKAGLHQLPLPVFKLSDSQKAPYLVHVADLAALIDERAAVSRENWTKSQV